MILHQILITRHVCRAIRSLADDTAGPLRGFSVLAGENVINAPVDNEISRQFHRRANAGAAS